MDYEKKYKEVLKKIREGLQPSPDGTKISGVTRAFLEEVFPELAESEDERVRKDLLAFIKAPYVYDFIVHERVDPWIAWLEKQESVGEIVERCKNSWYNEGKIDGMAEGLTEDEKYQQGWHDALEKQGEQKPFDYENATIQQKDFAPKVDMPRYSIGDVLCDKSCTTLNKESQPNIEILDIRNGMYICNNCSFPIEQQDEYELVAKRVAPKQEWSEEDENMFDFCCDYLDAFLERLKESVQGKEEKK